MDTILASAISHGVAGHGASLPSGQLALLVVAAVALVLSLALPAGRRGGGR